MATCKPIGVDLDAVIALQVSLPDSGVVEEGDTIVPFLRALNGYGDSVAADEFCEILLAESAGTGKYRALFANMP